MKTRDIDGPTMGDFVKVFAFASAGGAGLFSGWLIAAKSWELFARLVAGAI